MGNIVWDIKTKGIQREVLPEPCIKCGKPGSMEAVIGQHYLQIMLFIPMFPMGKSGWCTCKSCKQDLVLNDLPPSYKAVDDKLYKKARTPLWVWSGTLVLLAIAILGAIFMTADKKRNARMLESIQKGDMIGIERPDEKYELYRVIDVRNDSVFYRVSKRTENEIYLLDDLKEKGDEEFRDDTLFIQKKTLVDMNSAGTLEEITRKEAK